jgi:hypothetical protein
VKSRAVPHRLGRRMNTPVARTMRRSFLTLISSLVFASCATAKTLTAAEMRSNLHSALSLISETGLLVDQIEKGRELPKFSAGHAEYLHDEALRQAGDLRGSQTDTGDANTPARCAEQLELLAHALRLLRYRNDVGTLAQVGHDVNAIRKSLDDLENGR